MRVTGLEWWGESDGHLSGGEAMSDEGLSHSVINLTGLGVLKIHNKDLQLAMRRVVHVWLRVE